MFRIKNNLYKTKYYWLAKKWFENKPVFLFWKAKFKRHRYFNTGKDGLRFLWPTLPSFIKTITYLAIVVYILELFNKVYPVKISFDDNAVDTLLAAIASITGVFLGLYFAAISSIASNLLVRATQDIRHFFLSSPRGQQYVKTIASTGVITIFLIITKAFGHTLHPFSLIFVAILTMYTILRFWSVGSDVFNSLEPKDSFPWITKDIADSIRNVTPPGFQWRIPAIQNHHTRLVEYDLDLLMNLINFGIEEIKLSDEQLLIAVKHLAGLLSYYSVYKNKIPTNSYWFKDEFKFENWMLADRIKISLAMHTGTTIMPKTVKNYIWFEEKIIDSCSVIIKHFIKNDSVESAARTIDILVNVAEIYGKNFDEQANKLIINELDKFTDLIPESKNIPEFNKEKLAFIDSRNRLVTSSLLGLYKYLNESKVETLEKAFLEIDWINSKESVYSSGLPHSVLFLLESLSIELKNEKLVEGKKISPEWYIKTLCFQKYLFSLQTYFIFAKSFHESYFQTRYNKFLLEKKLSSLAQLIIGWNEFTNKYRNMVAILKIHVEECNKFHQVKDLPWPQFDFEDEEKIVLDREKEVTDKMISLLPSLQGAEVGDSLPDYFGQALTLGVQACYDACENNDQERLKNIFPSVFNASLAAYDLTRQKVQSWSQEQSKIIYSTEPLINLFEVSGYAKLYSELYQNAELWNIAQGLWNIYLDAGDAKQMIQFIASLSGYRDSLFVLMPQDDLRAGWQMIFGRKMEESEGQFPGNWGQVLYLNIFNVKINAS
ncbi:MAG: hypothetical protein PF572_04215 [Patescibacteria group bacterium]|jgi:hypothetical protein|nr:hypothetical protein [Patescibacteria group bacterium]